MPYPKNLAEKYLARIDELVACGEKILEEKKHIAATYSRSATYFDGSPAIAVPAHTTINFDKFITYRTSSTTLLATLIPEEHILFKTVQSVLGWEVTDTSVVAINSVLRAVKDDLSNGFLDDVADRIEAEISGDYLTQAEALLKEGRTGNYDHIPAAVLAGAVLEKSLRSLCDKQTPPIPIHNNGEPKTLNPLIDDLKKAGVFNELKAKQLRAWADIRNKAAHGEFAAFDRHDVETMIAGISSFLA